MFLRALVTRFEHALFFATLRFLEIGDQIPRERLVFIS